MKSSKRTVISNADYARFISKNSGKYLSKFNNFYKHAKKKLLEIKQQHPSPKMQKAVIAIKGGTSSVALIIAVILVGLIAVVGILPAISNPSSIDDSTKAKISEVTCGFAALAQSAAEYHAASGEFPAQDFPIDGLVALSQRYGTFSCLARASKNDITYRFTFNNVISSSLTGCTLDMQITYDPSAGYVKRWLSTSTLPAKFWPQE